MGVGELSRRRRAKRLAPDGAAPHGAAGT